MNGDSFAGKFLRRLRKIDPDQVESFVGQVVRDREMLAQVLDRLPEGVIVTDSAARVQSINDAARRLLGLARVDAVGLEIRKLLKSRPLQTLAEEFLENREPIENREVVVRTPGHRHYAVSVLPIESEAGLMTHVIWVVGDRTEVQRLKGEKRTIENLESLATLTAGVAHEIKNPLNSLNIHAQLIAKAARDLAVRLPDEPSLDRLGRSTAVILEEIQRLARVVDDFTAAVRPVRPNLRKETVNKLAMNLAELVGPQCAERGIEMTLDLDPEIPQVLIDPEQIQQALLNLLKNAIEAIDKPDGRLILRTATKSDHVLVEVEDNGVGISEEDRLRIFEPYHTTKFNGTGLGLMVVYRIVRAHRGAVGLTSEVGSGTVFSIALPLDERPVKLLGAEVQPDLAALDEASKTVENP